MTVKVLRGKKLDATGCLRCILVSGNVWKDEKGSSEETLGIDSRHLGVTGRPVQSRLCWIITGISLEILYDGERYAQSHCLSYGGGIKNNLCKDDFALAS